jgi:hypothetical protein
MLQNQLEEIKGKLLDYVFVMYKDMNTDEKGVDYKEFYNECMCEMGDDYCSISLYETAFED